MFLKEIISVIELRLKSLVFKNIQKNFILSLSKYEIFQQVS